MCSCAFRNCSAHVNCAYLVAQAPAEAAAAYDKMLAECVLYVYE
jgi:hypothetical protein